MISIIIVCALLWLLLGFVAYMWSVKRTYTTYFDASHFILSLITGPVGLLICTIVIFFEKIPEWMESLIRHINKS